MNITQAEQAGVKAFNDGRMSAPALNGAFIAAACASATPLTKLLSAYSHGWHIANLANNAPVSTMPSIAELERIVCA